MKLLKDSRPDTQFRALQALALNPTKEAMPILLKKMASKTSGYRRYAARAIAGIGGKEAVAALEQAAKVETEPFLRRELDHLLTRLKKKPPE